MAIFHYSAKIISRANGSSAVIAAAYRHAATMTLGRENRTKSYVSKHDVVHTEIAYPKNAPSWVHALTDGLSPDAQSEAIWNAVEDFERRDDAQLAREVVVALPIELSLADNIAIVREFVTGFTDKGQIVDWAFHNMDGNPHAHIMLTLRPLGDEGFGKKKQALLNEDGTVMRSGLGDLSRIVYKNFCGDKADLLRERERWANLINSHLAAGGFEERIDHRSFAERGISLVPTQHRGLSTSQMDARGIHTERMTDIRDKAQQNYALLTAQPEIIFSQITDRKSVFNRQDIAKALHTYIEDNDKFQTLLARLEGHESLVRVRAATLDANDMEIGAAKYTTQAMIRLERDMATQAGEMTARRSHGVSKRSTAWAVKTAAKGEGFVLSDQQKTAVEIITQPGALACIVGLAGAGKSTLLKAARLAWEREGYNVRGLSLAGKAARGLMDASGINSRTLASLEVLQHHGQGLLMDKDVIVVDEAGMVGSKQLARLITCAHQAGAKIVLVGDPAQLPPINAGAAFRAVTERAGFAEVNEIRRQDTDWMRRASLDFARGLIGPAISAYEARGSAKAYVSQAGAIAALAEDFGDVYKTQGTCLALAYTNAMVQRLNLAIQTRLRRSGFIHQSGREDLSEFDASSGPLGLGEGDRIVFLQNDKALGGGEGVTNGTLAQVVRARPGHLTVRLESGDEFSFNAKRYNSLALGFAVTIHKSQGVTVDHSFVLAQRSMTRNLAYVAMTRHKLSAQLYYSRQSFAEPYVQGGIAGALSRPDDKASTLDYEDGIDYAAAMGFGARRGLDTQKALLLALKQTIARRVSALASLAARLIKAAPSDAQWIIPPKTGYTQSAEAVAHAETLSSPDYLQTEARARDLIGDVYARPDSVWRQLRSLIFDPAIGTEDLRDRLGQDATGLGVLKRGGSILPISGRREARGQAKAAAKRLRIALIEWNRMYMTSYGQSVRREREARDLARDGLAPLSTGALRLLGRLDTLEGEGFDKLAASDVERLKQAEQFIQAVERRFGTGFAVFDSDFNSLPEAQREDAIRLKGYEESVRLSVRIVARVAAAQRRRTGPDMSR